MKFSLFLTALTLTALSFPTPARAAPTDPILQIYSDSLTSYLPDTESAQQDVVPQAAQRGVGLDGSLRSPAALFKAPNGNPFGSAWTDRQSVAGVNAATGAPDIWEVDLSLPAEGVPWVIGRSYNNRQIKTGSHHDSNGVQGRNWFQISQPEILLYRENGPGDDEKDVLYLVYGADRYLEFERVDIVSGTSDTFIGVNGAAGVVLYEAGATNEPDTYTYTDQVGTEYVFFGFDADSSPAEGQLWKITDTAGVVTYVGDATTGSTAITSGFDGSGRTTKVYDDSQSTDRRFTYTYDGNGRLTEVSAETRTGGTWASPTGLAEVGKVEYSYYGASESHGLAGDLKVVTVTTPLSDSGVELVKEKYYRYYVDADSLGNDHDIKLVVGFEGCRKYDWLDSTFDDDFLLASDASLQPYAEAGFEYDSSHRATKAWNNGNCGCSGNADGTHLFEYETNGSYTDGTGYDQTWPIRTVVEQPDGSYRTFYLDEAYQPLSEVLTDADPDNTSPVPDQWVTKVTRDTSGIVTDVHTPANVTGYTHSTGAFTTSTSAGLVWTYTLISASSATDGFVSDRKWKEGTSGSAYLEQTLTYGTASYTVSDASVERPVIASDRRYDDAITTGTSGSVLWSYATTYHDTSGRKKLAVEDVDTTLPAIASGNNGSGSSDVVERHYDESGRFDYEKTASGIIHFTEFTGGQPTEKVRDADTGFNNPGETFHQKTVPTGFGSSGTELHWATELSYDPQGRLDERQPPGTQITKAYYTKLADGRQVQLAFNDYDSSTPKYYGPVRYTVLNHAGNADATGTIALTGNETTTALSSHIDETDADLITAIDEGTLSALQVSVYDESGTQREESRRYFSIPASGDGTEGTHYDATFFGYDDRGRQTRRKEPSSTIHRMVYDLRGQVTDRYIGTNDFSFAGGESSGTDNMVKTEALAYDAGNDGGNGLLTERTLYVEDGTTGQRVTSYSYDVRGNLVLETAPLAPHSFHKYDNRDRRVATGLFSSTASINTSTDDPTSEATNRLALRQWFFDEQGRTWKEQVHNIDDADGSDDDNLQTLRWWDASGRLVKVDGERLEKFAYDRIDRETHRFVLASDDDTAYGDTDDVTGDIVLEEHQTTYDPDDGDVIMQAVIERLYTDYGGSENTGALDTNADGDNLLYTAANLNGRIQITALWHGLQGVTDTVIYGDYGGSNFDRDGLSAPTRSDTALRTTNTYNGDGTLQKMEDPRGLVTYFEYDDAGRKTKDVRNYDASVNSGNPSGADDNQTVLWEYTDALMTKMTVDVPSGGTDQATTYTYGTTKGATAGDSKIATGHLLQETKYPDSAGASDVVSMAYNAQSEEIWREDQAGNVFETDYDTAGRRTHERVTTLDADFDGAIRRKSFAYTDLGQAETVTQYDNAAVGSGTVQDEVKFSYDGWGNVSAYDQDRNSAVSGSGDEYTVSYTYGKATTGRNTVRRTAATLPGGTALTYTYSSDSGLHDDETSRVSTIKQNTVHIAEYRYDGAAFVARTRYPAESLMSEPDRDRFQRVTTSKWTKDLATDQDFYAVDLTYDRNSNIVLSVNVRSAHARRALTVTGEGPLSAPGSSASPSPRA